QSDAWSFFRPIAEQFDAAVFSLPAFVGSLAVTRYIVAPSIDPLSEKNRDLGAAELASALHALALDRERPLLVQAGPLTRGGDPLPPIPLSPLTHPPPPL